MRLIIDTVGIISSGGSEKSIKHKSCPKVDLCERENTQGSLGVRNKSLQTENRGLHLPREPLRLNGLL